MEETFGGVERGVEGGSVLVTRCSATLSCWLSLTFCSLSRLLSSFASLISDFISRTSRMRRERSSFSLTDEEEGGSDEDESTDGPSAVEGVDITEEGE